MASDEPTVRRDGGPDTESGARTAATASTIRVTGFVGVVSPFDGNQEEWAEYAERLEHYFTANDIVDIAKRRAILLNGVGAPTYLPPDQNAVVARHSEGSHVRGDSRKSKGTFQPESISNSKKIRI